MFCSVCFVLKIKMGRHKKELSERVKDFQQDGLYLSDTNIVMCKHCNVRLDGDKTDTLKKHTMSSNHLKKKTEPQPGPSGSKRQSTIIGGFEVQKRVKMEKETFVEDTVKMCLKANIPMHKLDHPAVRSYLKKYVPGSGNLPSGDTLRRKYVPLCGIAEKEETKEKLKNQPVVVVADETSDKQGRCVFAVLFKTVNAEPEQSCFLASVYFLDAANGSTCSQAIMDTLKAYDIDYFQVQGLVSDSARYMTACFNMLKILIGDHILHYQCWAHKINLVGDIFIKEFKELNTIVAKTKAAFLHSRKMKSAYLKYLQEHVPLLTPKLYPTPVVTRWNSWFKSAIYLNEYVEHIIAFLNDYEDDNMSTSYLTECFENETLARKIRVQLTFVFEFCPKIMEIIDNLEGSKYPFANILWSKLEDLKSSLERQREGSFGDKTKSILLDENGEFHQEHSIMLKTAAQKSLDKLSSHMRSNPTNDSYLHIGKLFCPSVAAAVTTSSLDTNSTLESFSKIPFFRDIAQDELLSGYAHFHRQLVNVVQQETPVNVMQILLASKCCNLRFANAAIQSIHSPVNSVDAERYFSIYNVVINDRRQRLKQENIETTTMLAFN